MDYKWKDFRVILAARNRTTRNIMQKRWICNSNELRDNIAEMLEKVTATLKYRQLYNRYPVKKSKENQSGEARSDISARGFCIKEQRAFFVIRIFDPNTQRHQSKKAKTL